MGAEALIAIAAVSAAATVAQGVQQAQTSARNARILRERGAAAAEQQRIRNRLILGRQRAAFGAANVVGTTPASVLFDTAAQGELAALRAQFGFDAEAFSEEQAGRSALVGSLFQAGSTLLGGAFTASQAFPRGTPTAGGATTTGTNQGPISNRGVFELQGTDLSGLRQGAGF